MLKGFAETIKSYSDSACKVSQLYSLHRVNKVNSGLTQAHRLVRTARVSYIYF